MAQARGWAASAGARGGVAGDTRWQPWPAPTVGLDARASSSLFILRDTKSWAAAGSQERLPSLSLKFPSGCWQGGGGRGGWVAAARHHRAAPRPHTFGPCGRSRRRGAEAVPRPDLIVLRPRGPGAGTAICSSLPAASLFTARRTLAQEAAPHVLRPFPLAEAPNEIKDLLQRGGGKGKRAEQFENVVPGPRAGLFGRVQAGPGAGSAGHGQGRALCRGRAVLRSGTRLEAGVVGAVRGQGDGART